MTTTRNRPANADTYRGAVSSAVRALQRTHGLSDGEFAERIGCSPGTIRNVRAEQTSLDPVLLLRLEQEFGPGAIDPVLRLAEVRAYPLPTSMTKQDPVLAVVEALHRIIEVHAIDGNSKARITPAELRRIIVELRHGRAALDTLIARADGSGGG
ncbi:helix-turn-helix domain-containing protein [Novosphingobium sp. 9]|uniref:helix-turn-helix domain-containing protein n=1 Tax=Novosphingobium sp. 9 TaxID=2025349 RepID=UPI0021B4E39B|nr:helix-turn-helix transcriptional regulator [Novosphingobium sp. 9]